MNFCDDHWSRLRQKIDEAGLGGFVASSGQEFASKMERQMGDGEVTVDNFDPLIGAHNAIWINLAYIDRAVLTMEGCCLCYGNKMHLASCKEPQCTEENFFDWMLDKAVEEQVEIARGLQ